MRILVIITAFLLLQSPLLKGQTTHDMDAIMTFLGTDDPQEIDSDEVERLEFLMDHHLRINHAHQQELREAGIFSQYQTAVLSDYISRHGAVKTFMELSFLDGFNEGFVRKISPFIDLSVNEHPDSFLRQEVAVRGSGKWQESQDPAAAYAMKYRINASDLLTGTVAVSRPYGASSVAPSVFSVSIGWSPARWPLKVIVGDFNARFGQGLTLWNNSFMTSLTTPDNFMKRPTGVSQPWSFTGSNALTGVAAEVSVGHWQASVLASFPGIKNVQSGKLQFMPAFNLSRFGRFGHISFTNVLYLPLTPSAPGLSVKSGIDAAFCINGVNLFGEMSCDWVSMKPNILAGTRFRAGERTDMAVLARVFLGDQYGLACSGMHTLRKDLLTWVLDAVSNSSGHQIKALVTYERSFSDSWKLKFRLSERIRTWGLPLRTDARADIVYTAVRWTSSLRLNILGSDKTGYLSYAEAGYIGDKLTAYLRQGIFFIDDWDDRIYVYERDAPGSFNVPAMYGRGVWASLTASLRLSSSLRLHSRASFTSYPFMQKKKPGKAELKLQLQWRF